MEQPTLFDQPRYTLHRKGAPQTSIDAAYAVNLNRLEKLVMDAIVESGENGITAGELLRMFPAEKYSSITARPSSLERKGLIYYREDKRDKQRVMRAV